MDRWTRNRLRLVVYSILGVVALTIAGDRLIAWRFDPLRTNSENGVILYSAAWCGYCAEIRRCLTESRVPFDERDVEKSLQASVEWWALRVRGVPVTVVGQELIYGFQTKELTQALGAAGFTIGCWPN